MKAAILAESGLRVADIPPPEIGPGEVLVRVRSAGLNRADTLRAAGAFHGSRDSPGTVLGLEWAGEVVQTGTGVENFRAGDRVMCAGQGGYAEFAKAHAEDCMHIPEEIDGYEKMAVLPIAMRTMHDAIVTNGRMSAGETVLVQGAATGVGLLGLQIARALGARLVIGTSTRAERRARLAEFGADLALDSTDSNWPEAVLEATDGHGVDLIIDQISGAVVLGNLRAAAIRGRIVNVGRLGAGEGDFDYEMHAAKRITYIGVTFRSRSEEEKHTVSRLAYAALGPDLTAGRYHLPIDRAFRLEEINEAHAYMRANNHFGKIAVTI